MRPGEEPWRWGRGGGGELIAKPPLKPRGGGGVGRGGGGTLGVLLGVNGPRRDDSRSLRNMSF